MFNDLDPNVIYILEVLLNLEWRRIKQLIRWSRIRASIQLTILKLFCGLEYCLLYWLSCCGLAHCVPWLTIEKSYKFKWKKHEYGL